MFQSYGHKKRIQQKRWWAGKFNVSKGYPACAYSPQPTVISLVAFARIVVPDFMFLNSLAQPKCFIMFALGRAATV